MYMDCCLAGFIAGNIQRNKEGRTKQCPEETYDVVDDSYS